MMSLIIFAKKKIYEKWLIISLNVNWPNKRRKIAENAGQMWDKVGHI